MKITHLTARTVAIPLEAPLRHNTGVHPGYFLRTIIEVHTDEGIVGLGEVGGGDQRGKFASIKQRIIGEDPFHLNRIKQKTLRQIYYLSNPRIYGAIEIACLDIIGGTGGSTATRPSTSCPSPELRSAGLRQPSAENDHHHARRTLRLVLQRPLPNLPECVNHEDSPAPRASAARAGRDARSGPLRRGRRCRLVGRDGTGVGGRGTAADARPGGVPVRRR